MRRLQNIAMCDYQESVTTRQTHTQMDRQIDARQTEPYVLLCFSGDTIIINRVCAVIYSEWTQRWTFILHWLFCENILKCIWNCSLSPWRRLRLKCWKPAIYYRIILTFPILRTDYKWWSWSCTCTSFKSLEAHKASAYTWFQSFQ